MWGAADIRMTIRQGQSQRVAWLADDASLQDIGEIIVAMGNSSGGTLFIGVSGGMITGVTDAEPVIDRMLEAALIAEPTLIMPVPYPVKVEEKTVIVAEIPSGMPGVYAFEGKYLQRVDDDMHPLSPRELRRLMMERGEWSFETEIIPGTGKADIDWDKATDYVQKLRGTGSDDVEDVLINRGCLTLVRGFVRATHAGMLLFGKSPQQYITNSGMTAVRFAGDTMSDTHTRQDINGTLIDQIKRAETFLYDHLRKAVTLNKNMARDEAYEYPMEAAREVVINAVAHRDYSIRGDCVRLFVFSDRLEVHSPGGLPGPMTIQNLREERFSRNPIIVQVLSDFQFIERLGYGVDRVLELMQAQNLKEPEFQERAGGFTVVLHNAAVIPLDEPAEDEHEEPAEEKTLVFNGLYEGKEINARQEGALTFLHTEDNTRITNRDLQELFPDVHSETIRRDLVDLVKKGILKKLGQKRGSYYVLKQPETEPQNDT